MLLFGCDAPCLTCLSMKISSFLLVSTVCSLSSCFDYIRDQTFYPPPKFELDQSDFSNEDLINAAYSSYKTPSGFYTENLGDTSLYYVNTISIDSAVTGSSIELSTTNSDIALNWSKVSTYENSQFILGLESEKYFEFIRIANPVDNLLIKFRTHREDYFSRSGFNFLDPTDSIGTFTKASFSTEDAKELIDYLWFTDNYKKGYSKILSSFAEKTNSTIKVFHFELFIMSGDFNIKDEVALQKSIYEIQLDNGQVIHKAQLVRTIIGN